MYHYAKQVPTTTANGHVPQRARNGNLLKRAKSIHPKRNGRIQPHATDPYRGATGKYHNAQRETGSYHHGQTWHIHQRPTDTSLNARRAHIPTPNEHTPQRATCTYPNGQRSHDPMGTYHNAQRATDNGQIFRRATGTHHKAKLAHTNTRNGQRAQLANTMTRNDAQWIHTPTRDGHIPQGKSGTYHYAKRVTGNGHNMHILSRATSTCHNA